MALTLEEIKAKVEENIRKNKLKRNEDEKAYQQWIIDNTIAKKDLIIGQYYIGNCRNANIARWDGNMFYHWRTKFGNRFIEAIKHYEDEQYYDVFYPYEVYELQFDDDINVVTFDLK